MARPSLSVLLKIVVSLGIISIILLKINLLNKSPNVIALEERRDGSNSDCTQRSPLSSREVRSVKRGPLLDPSYKTETLTRLASDLGIDLHVCPPGSRMTNVKIQNSPPQFDDCPTLFVVGARKGGSTSMIQYVSKHEGFKAAGLNTPKVGELFFFSNKFYKPNQNQWNWYQSNFPPDTMSGESSVTYLVHCQVPQRVFSSCGKQAKIVMLLRNPVDRFISNFLMRVRVSDYGNTITEMTPIRSVMEDELTSFRSKMSNVSFPNVQQGWKNILCKFRPTESMIFEGMYYVHLLNWMCNFPAENIMIINSEEFYHNTSIILNQVFQFLGLHPLEQEELKRIVGVAYNQGSYEHIPRHQQLSKDDRQKLNEVFKPFNKALLNLLNWNIDWI